MSRRLSCRATRRRPRHSTVAFSMDSGPLDMLVQIVHAGKTDVVLPAQPWPERTHHVTSENGWATTTTILQVTATLDNVLNRAEKDRRGSFSGTWPASTPARPRWLPCGPFCLTSCCASSRHDARRTCSLATSGRLPQLQELHPGASERHSCPLRHRRLVRRLGNEQGMAAPVIGSMGGSRTHGPLRRE